MFQVLKFEVPAKDTDTNIEGKVVIDDQLKSQYRGIEGLIIWTPETEDMRLINMELDIDNTEVFPAGFPVELFSANLFRDTQPLKLDFPKDAKIEGAITNGNTKPVSILLIFNVKL